MKELNLFKWSIPLLVGILALTYIVLNWPALAAPFVDLLGAFL